MNRSSREPSFSFSSASELPSTHSLFHWKSEQALAPHLRRESARESEFSHSHPLFHCEGEPPSGMFCYEFSPLPPFDMLVATASKKPQKWKMFEFVKCMCLIIKIEEVKSSIGWLIDIRSIMNRCWWLVDKPVLWWMDVSSWTNRLFPPEAGTVSIIGREKQWVSRRLGRICFHSPLPPGIGFRCWCPRRRSCRSVAKISPVWLAASVLS